MMLVPTPIVCFRCHADEHEGEDSRIVSPDCEICHILLAWDETDRNGLPGISEEAILR